MTILRLVRRDSNNARGRRMIDDLLYNRIYSDRLTIRVKLLKINIKVIKTRRVQT